jgi:PBP1b-binding outer membrane lipoprotein LpoB
MKNIIIISFILFCLNGCGVKAAPQPPYSAEQAAAVEAQEKANIERRKTQLAAIEERKKKIQEEEEAERAEALKKQEKSGQ